MEIMYMQDKTHCAYGMHSVYFVMFCYDYDIST